MPLVAFAKILKLTMHTKKVIIRCFPFFLFAIGQSLQLVQAAPVAPRIDPKAGAPLRATIKQGTVALGPEPVTVSVGKMIKLSIEVQAGYTVTSWNWAIAGDDYAEWIADQDHTELVNTVVNEATTSFFWKKDGKYSVVFTGTAQKTGTNGGTPKACQGEAKFIVTRPTYAFNLTDTGTIALDLPPISGELGGVPVTSTDVWLRYGKAPNYQGNIDPQNRIPAGITFSTTPPPNSPNKTLRLVQVATNISHKRLKKFNTSPTPIWQNWWTAAGADTYPMFASDSPDSIFDPAVISEIERDESFDTWLMYRPSEDDQFVPIKKLSWSWKAHAKEETTGWVLKSSTRAGNQTGVDTYDYPSWTHGIQEPADGSTDGGFVPKSPPTTP